MADLVRNDGQPSTEPVVEKAEHSTTEKPVEGVQQTSPQVQVVRGNIDLVMVKLLEAINNNLVAILNVLGKDKNG